MPLVGKETKGDAIRMGMARPGRRLADRRPLSAFFGIHRKSVRGGNGVRWDENLPVMANFNPHTALERMAARLFTP
jgi:hypothetical protein